jgi:hypothetical protein
VGGLVRKHSTPKLPDAAILSWVSDNLVYEPDTGILRWKTSGGVTHKHKAGDLFFPSFHARKSRTRVVNIGYGKGRVSAQYHHVCWYLAYGVWADHPIDHANRDDKDNRLGNLRRTDDTLNAYNSPSVALYKGVTKRPYCATYRARITVNGKRIDLGRGYKTAEDAFAAYKAASAALHGAFSCVEQRKSSCKNKEYVACL